MFGSSSPSVGRTVYNVTGGILAWNDQTIPDFPNLRIFDLEGDTAAILYQAMDLERGAHRFYNAVLKMYPGKEFSRIIDLLARAEKGHARLIYTFWSREQQDPLPFSQLYEALPGILIEGGESFDSMISHLDRLADDSDLEIVEMALAIELAAYDLYRNMAHHFVGSDMEKIFLSIAQAEKEHMRLAADALVLVG